MLQAITSLDAIFVLSGIVLLVIGGFTFTDRMNPARIGTGVFWILLGLAFALGSFIPVWMTGVLVIAMVVVDGLGVVRKGNYDEASHEERVRAADRFGWRLFLPVLMIPTLTYAT